MASSFYEAKKTLSLLEMPYKKIHACPNDCIQYRKKFENEVSCPVCGVSRWQKKRNSEEVRDGVPAKLLWYIPPILRFVRLFRNPDHTKNLTWHANERIQGGKL